MNQGYKHWHMGRPQKLYVEKDRHTVYTLWFLLKRFQKRQNSSKVTEKKAKLIYSG